MAAGALPLRFWCWCCSVLVSDWQSEEAIIRIRNACLQLCQSNTMYVIHPVHLVVQPKRKPFWHFLFLFLLREGRILKFSQEAVQMTSLTSRELYPNPSWTNKTTAWSLEKGLWVHDGSWPSPSAVRLSFLRLFASVAHSPSPCRDLNTDKRRKMPQWSTLWSVHWQSLGTSSVSMTHTANRMMGWVIGRLRVLVRPSSGSRIVMREPWSRIVTKDPENPEF